MRCGMAHLLQLLRKYRRQSSLVYKATLYVAWAPYADIKEE